MKFILYFEYSATFQLALSIKKINRSDLFQKSFASAEFVASNQITLKHVFNIDFSWQLITTIRHQNGNHF